MGHFVSSPEKGRSEIEEIVKEMKRFRGVREKLIKVKKEKKYKRPTGHDSLT